MAEMRRGWVQMMLATCPAGPSKDASRMNWGIWVVLPHLKREGDVLRRASRTGGGRTRSLLHRLPSHPADHQNLTALQLVQDVSFFLPSREAPPLLQHALKAPGRLGRDEKFKSFSVKTQIYLVGFSRFFKSFIRFSFLFLLLPFLTVQSLIPFLG